MRILLLTAVLFFSLIARPQTSLIIPENTFIPEGIAADPRNGDLYVTSIAKHKITRISANGTVHDFIREGQHGFLEGLGLKVDVKRNILWVLSNKREKKWFTSQVQGFDIKTAELKYHHAYKDTLIHLLNDLIIDKEGNLLVSDTYSSTIYKYYPESKQFQPWLVSELIKWPNGLVFDNNNHLYIATYGKGLAVVDPDTKAVRQLQGYKDSTIAFGLDGLEYKNGNLYGIFNADTVKHAGVVINYKLDEKKGTVISESIIDRGNKYFYDPTTAAIYGNKLYVIANSHLDQYNKNKESTAGIEHMLLPVRILAYTID